MARKTEVPITPSVVKWAIAESGLSLGEVASGTGVEEQDLQRWLAAGGKPSVTEVKQLAKTLHRQVAVFLLPAPPREDPVHVQFRHPIGARSSRALTADERRFLRRARRLQSAQRWLEGELGQEPPDIPEFNSSTTSDAAASDWRARLDITVDTQLAWRSASAAFDAWRNAVEATGVTVVQFSMGTESCRGFSLWDEWAPLIAVNTAWTDEARVFTLFHELGHLLTRTNSACAAAPAVPHAGDPSERWCEAFAAGVLIPRESLSSVTRVDSLPVLSSIARRLHVSLRATAIRLIEAGKASWSLYDAIPAVSDAKKRGGGGTGRNRREIREDEFGSRVTDIFVSAVQREIISESQALDFLDIPSSEFERLSGTAGR